MRNIVILGVLVVALLGLKYAMDNRKAPEKSLQFRKFEWGMSEDEVKKMARGQLIEDKGLMSNQIYLVYQDAFLHRAAETKYLFANDRLCEVVIKFVIKSESITFTKSEFEKIVVDLSAEYGPGVSRNAATVKFPSQEPGRIISWSDMKTDMQMALLPTDTTAVEVVVVFGDKLFPTRIYNNMINKL